MIKYFFVTNIANSIYRNFYIASLEEIVSLGYIQSYSNYLNQIYDSIVMTENDIPIGHYTFIQNKNDKLLSDSFIYIIPEKRNNGFAVQLIEKGKLWAIGKEYNKIIGAVSKQNTIGINTALASGYVSKYEFIELNLQN